MYYKINIDTTSIKLTFCFHSSYSLWAYLFLGIKIVLWFLCNLCFRCSCMSLKKNRSYKSNETSSLLLWGGSRVLIFVSNRFGQKLSYALSPFAPPISHPLHGNKSLTFFTSNKRPAHVEGEKFENFKRRVKHF